MRRIARQLDGVQLLPNIDARLRRIERRGLLGQRLLAPLGGFSLLSGETFTKVRGRFASQG